MIPPEEIGIPAFLKAFSEKGLPAPEKEYREAFTGQKSRVSRILEWVIVYERRIFMRHLCFAR
ncbi:MAG: hypothetical protein LBE84_10540 [Planctomycetota bacterium]|jgi:hypothetical protein|nr:hypothetical protein [Planctomycetota bacterium]